MRFVAVRPFPQDLSGLSAALVLMAAGAPLPRVKLGQPFACECRGATRGHADTKTDISQWHYLAPCTRWCCCIRVGDRGHGGVSGVPGRGGRKRCLTWRSRVRGGAGGGRFADPTSPHGAKEPGKTPRCPQELSLKRTHTLKRSGG